jgi:hypothetical protein
MFVVAPLRRLEPPAAAARDLALVAAAPSANLPERMHVPIEAMELALERSDDGESLKQLQAAAATWEAAARRFEVARGELVRLAVFRLRVERKLGAELMRLVRRGGDRPRSTKVTLVEGRLPFGLTKQMAAKYRQLAAIADAEFQRYLDWAEGEHRVPSANGARAFACRDDGEASVRRRGVDRRPRVAVPSVVPASVVDALRFMEVEVVVGAASCGSARCVPAATAKSGDLRGRVFVAECPDPATWVPKLAALRGRAAIEEVLVLVPPSTDEAWFKALEEGGWSCCFLRGEHSGAIAAYLGSRGSAFWLVFRQLGAVFGCSPESRVHNPRSGFGA